MAWTDHLRAAAHAAALATTLAGPGALAGCGVVSDEADLETSGETAEADVHVADGVVVADPEATRTADVTADRVVFPAHAGDRYRAMAPGTVFVGSRGPREGRNPDGFLRRVTSVTVEGDSVVVATTPAVLTDAIVAGSVRASSGGGKMDDHLTSAGFAGIELDLDGETLFDHVDDVEVAGKRASFHETITLERAKVEARPAVEIDLRITNGAVTRLVAKVEGNLDASIRAVANVSSSGVVDEETRAALAERTHEVERRIYQSRRLPLPTFSAGKVPVSPSVEFRIALRCTLAFGGAIRASAGVDATSYVRLGGVYDRGEWGPPIRSDFDVRPSFELTRGAEAKARCALVAEAELFVYGASAVAMNVAPYLDFDVAEGIREFGPQPYVYKVRAGATGTMTGRDGVLGLPASELDRDLVTWKADEALNGSMR